MKIKHLQKIQRFLNIAGICKEAGLNYKKIIRKLKKETELTVTESNDILNVLLLIQDQVEEKFDGVD